MSDETGPKPLISVVDKPTNDELTKRATDALATLQARGRRPATDALQLAYQCGAIQNLLIRAGLATQDDIDHEILTVQAENLEAMVAATAGPTIIVPDNLRPFPGKPGN